MSTSKKVAIISAVFPPYKGGIGNVAYNHARILSERGCNVNLFTPDYGYSSYSEPSPQPSPLKGEGVSVVRLKPVIKYGNAAWVPQLCNQLRDFDTVILEYPFYGGMKAVYRAKKKYNFKLIVFYHMDTVAGGLKGLIFKYTKRFFLPRIVKIADMVVASSEDYAKHSDLGKYWQDDNLKFKVLPIGVDVLKFNRSPADSAGRVEIEQFRKHLNIKPDEKIILFVGGLDRAHYFKGVEYLIKAIPLVSLRGGMYSGRRGNLNDAMDMYNKYDMAQRDDKIAALMSTFARNDTRFKVVIVGRGELQQEYRALSEKLGVKDKILFTGGIKDEALIKLYQMAYITVLLSIDQSEAFGIVLVEAMACGCPVIASDLPGVRSVFEDGVIGFVSKVKDEKDIADKISFILNNPDKREQMSKACARLAREKYNWDKIGNSLEELV